jgi:hypothetical protein
MRIDASLFIVAKTKTHRVALEDLHSDAVFLYVCRSKAIKMQWPRVSLIGKPCRMGVNLWP